MLHCVHLSGHLPGVATPVRTCAATGLTGFQSTKKPIRVFLSRCKWYLKQLTESTSNKCWSMLFHLLISLSVKKLCLNSKLLLCLTSLNLCPLRCFAIDNSNIDSRGVADHPLAIFHTLMMSALFRLFISSKLRSLKRSSLSQYGYWSEVLTHWLSWLLAVVEDEVENVEKRSEDVQQQQSMAESTDYAAGKRCTTELLKPVLLTPCRPTSATDTALQATVTVPSDAADTHSHGNKQIKHLLNWSVYLY